VVDLQRLLIGGAQLGVRGVPGGDRERAGALEGGAGEVCGPAGGGRTRRGVRFLTA
jgi:hypothetical protein